VSLMRADGIVDFFPVAEFAVEFFHLQRAGRDLVELGVGAIGAFDGAVEFGRTWRQDEEVEAALLAGLFELGGELRAAIDLEGTDRKRHTVLQSVEELGGSLSGGASVRLPLALRAQDTLLLANLMEGGDLPLFVPTAIVEHGIPLSLIGCIRKDIRSVYLEGRTYDIIASKGVRIRVTHRERLKLLLSMWKTSGQKSIGRSAWFVLVGSQAFQRMLSFSCQFLRVGTAHRV